MDNNKKSAAMVFVTQESESLNYTPAEQFGEIVFMTRSEVSPVPGSLVNAAVVQQLRQSLAAFNPRTDYIAPSGSPVVSGIAFMLLGALFGGQDTVIRVLRWSNRDRMYQPISINLP